MAYDKINKKLYVTEDSGITPWEIAQCLDDYRVNTRGQRDVGMLCTSPNINMWAKYKPIRRPEFVELTDEQRSKQSFGIDADGAHSSTFDALLTKAINSGCAYNYLKPRGLTTYKEPFRVLDFKGYNHYAEMPYKYTFVHIDGNLSGWMDVYVAPKAELMLSEIDPTLLPSSDMSKCNLALLYRKKGETSGGGCIFPKIDGKYITLADIENSDSAPVARFDMPGKGEYYFVAAVTDATEGNIEDMYWMYLPNALFLAKYDPSSKGFEWYYPDDYGVRHTMSPSSGGVGSVIVNFGINATDYTGGKGNLTIEIGEVSGSSFNGNGSAYEADFLEAGTVKDKTWTIETYEGLSTSNLYIKAYIEYKEADSSLSTLYMYFDFLQGKQVSSDPGPVSLAQIYAAWEW